MQGPLLRLPEDSPFRLFLRLPVLLGGLGVILCFGLPFDGPFGRHWVGLGIHVVSAALVVVALGLAMAEEAARGAG